MPLSRSTFHSIAANIDDDGEFVEYAWPAVVSDSRDTPMAAADYTSPDPTEVAPAPSVVTLALVSNVAPTMRLYRAKINDLPTYFSNTQIAWQWVQRQSTLGLMDADYQALLLERLPLYEAIAGGCHMGPCVVMRMAEVKQEPPQLA